MPMPTHRASHQAEDTWITITVIVQLAFEDSACGARGTSSSRSVHRVFRTLAGTPATTVLGDTSLVTTLPAPTTALSPIVIPVVRGKLSWNFEESSFNLLGTLSHQ